jgi:hypothetical protein
VGRIIEDTEAQRAADRELFALVDQAALQQRELEEEFAYKTQQRELPAVLREYRESPSYEPPSPLPAQPVGLLPASSLPWKLRHWLPSGLTGAELAAWLET